MYVNALFGSFSCRVSLKEYNVFSRLMPIILGRKKYSFNFFFIEYRGQKYKQTNPNLPRKMTQGFK